MAREKKTEEKKGAPEWLNTYADMVTLLLCFFVLLFSMSSVDAQKWREIVSVFNKNSGIFDKLNSTVENVEGEIEVDEEVYAEPAPQWVIVVNDVNSAIQQIEGEYGKLFGDNDIIVRALDTEIVIELPGDILFKVGEYTLEQLAKDVIYDVMETAVVANISALKEIRFEGHTDIRPIPSIPYDNKGLSAFRAIAVVEYVESLYPDIPKSMFGFIGYGPTRPVSDEHTEEAYRKNRRVAIVMVRKPESVEDVVGEIQETVSDGASADSVSDTITTENT